MANGAGGGGARRYGWRPSLPDHRDVLADTSEIPIREEVDPRGDYMTDVYDQLQLNDCTANAVAAAIDADRIVRGMAPIYPSRLGIYWLERFIEHQPVDVDNGAMGRDGFKAASKYGVLPESDLLYVDNTNSPEFREDPRQNPKWATDCWRLPDKYKSVPRSLSALKAVLSNRQTIAFGFRVPASFESEEMARTGIMAQPAESELTEEGHEVLAVGYLKEDPNYCLVRNSWGTGWGIKGYFLMPWTWLLDPGFTEDLRTIYRPL
jgi:C1A family cysteine protease